MCKTDLYMPNHDIIYSWTHVKKVEEKGETDPGWGCLYDYMSKWRCLRNKQLRDDDDKDIKMLNDNERPIKLLDKSTQYIFPAICTSLRPSKLKSWW